MWPGTVTVAFVKCLKKKTFGSKNGLLSLSSASFLLDTFLGLDQLLVRWDLTWSRNFIYILVPYLASFLFLWASPPSQILYILKWLYTHMYIFSLYIHVCVFICVCVCVYLAISSTVIFFRKYTQILLEKSPVRLWRSS